MLVFKEISQKKEINFEISKSYCMDIMIFGDVTVDENTHEDIQIEYNKENAIVTYEEINPPTRKNVVRYNIFLYDFAEGDTIKITYGGKTLEAKYNVIDYDFESNDRIKPASLDDLDKYVAFKDMLTSIEYYEFKEPYIGLNEREYDVNEKNGKISFGYENYEMMVNGYMSTDYLRYLKDSVYYPSKFIGYKMYMDLYPDTDINEGASRSVMDCFALYLPISDPHHNKGPDGITGAYFYANNLALYKYTDSGKPLTPIMILIEKYPDQFYQYRVDDVTIYVLSSKNSGAEAYFTHGDYFYSMYVTYDFD